MVKCTFCGKNVEPGSGMIYVYKTGKVANFCSRKCEKNTLKLGRKAIHTKWSERRIKE